MTSQHNLMEKNSKVARFRHGWIQELGLHLFGVLASLQASFPGRFSLPLVETGYPFFPLTAAKSCTITDWPSLGHMPIREPITGTRGLECSDHMLMARTSLGLLPCPTTSLIRGRESFPKRNGEPFILILELASRFQRI